MVVVRAVPAIFTIGLVMFFVVADQVVQRETIMRGDEVDAGGWPAPVALVQVAGAGEPVTEIGQLTVVALPIAPHGVAIPAVPFRPARREIAYLIATLRDVPLLGN